MTQTCPHCKAEYPDDADRCPVCDEPSPIWEKKEAARLLTLPALDIGYECAWPNN